MIAAVVEPMRSPVLAMPADWELIRAGKEGLDTTSAFVLQPKGVDSTRLLARLRQLLGEALVVHLASEAELPVEPRSLEQSEPAEF